MTQQALSDSMTGVGGEFASMTKQGAALNEVRKQFPEGEVQDKAVSRIIGVEPPAGDGAAASFAPLAPGVPTERLPLNTNLPELPKPGETPAQPAQEPDAERAVREELVRLMADSGDTSTLTVGSPEDFEAQLERLYDDVVKPGLNQALNDDRVLQSALQAFDRWRENLRSFEFFGADSSEGTRLGQRLAEGTQLAQLGLHSAVQQANRRAAAANDWRYIFDALDWADDAEAMGLVEDDDRLRRDQVLEEFDLEIVLFHNDLPATMAIGAVQQGRVSAGLKIAGNPLIVGEALRWQMAAVEGGPTTGLQKGW